MAYRRNNYNNNGNFNNRGMMNPWQGSNDGPMNSSYGQDKSMNSLLTAALGTVLSAAAAAGNIPQPPSLFGSNNKNNSGYGYGYGNANNYGGGGNNQNYGRRSGGDNRSQQRRPPNRPANTSERKNSDRGDKAKSERPVYNEDKYNEVPPSLLWCFVCQKHMWDPESFIKHVYGRAHQELYDILEQSYETKSNIIRASIRLEEEQYAIELERLRRSGKNTNVRQTFFCIMCDLMFQGTGAQHRRSNGHLRLKKFLHPNCRDCREEFPKRTAYWDHLLSPKHFLKQADIMTRTYRDEIAIVTEEEVEKEKDLPPADDTVVDAPDVILDITDDLTDLSNFDARKPAYKSDRPVGVSELQKDFSVTGKYCKCCRKFLLSDDCVSKHLRSLAHYSHFMETLTQYYKDHERRKRKSSDKDDVNEDGSKRAKNGDDQPCNEDDVDMAATDNVNDEAMEEPEERNDNEQNDETTDTDAPEPNQTVEESTPEKIPEVHEKPVVAEPIEKPGVITRRRPGPASRTGR